VNDLNDFFEDRSQRVPTVGFDQADGMKTSECNTGQPAGWRMQDGTLWFPTIQGIASLDPANVALPTGQFQVKVESLINNGEPLDIRQPKVSVAPGDRRFEFNYTALTYTAPERVHFRYRLEGLDQDWVEAGRRRTAYYTNVPPGQYTFRVMASLRDGIWNPTSGTITFELTPRFYETRWFPILLALAVATVWLLWHRQNVRNLKQREAELAAMETAFAERAKAEHDLAASEARYRNLVESAVYGIFRADPDCNLLETNRALRRILGYEEGDSLRHLNVISDLIVDRAEHERLKAQLATGRIENQETHWRRKDGRVITVRLSGRASRTDLGEIESFEVIVEDITERRTLEEQLRQAQKMDAVGRLAGGVAHDFNNLMTVVLGYSDVLMDELPKKGASTREMEEIRKAAKRAADLTAQLLAFSRRQVLAPKVLDLNSVIAEMERLLARLLPENIRLETSLASDLWCVKADPGQIEQVLMNLAVNARDAMPHGGTVRIETANQLVKQDTSDLRAGQYVVVKMRDEGSGIAPAALPRIFEPFFTTKEQGKGTGLGLSTVYGILKQSGGHIGVETTIGAGTTFTIYLPATATERVREAEPAPNVADGGKETVLVVEDEEGVRSLVTHLLRRAGYAVHEAADPRTALSIAERNGAIDLVLTDMVLGQMSGRELSQKLKVILPHAQFIFMSGYTDLPISQEDELPEHFIAKPFTNAGVLEGVRKVLDSRGARAAARSL
jgi:PAS domain S-box-containing protein